MPGRPSVLDDADEEEREESISGPSLLLLSTTGEEGCGCILAGAAADRVDGRWFSSTFSEDEYVVRLDMELDDAMTVPYLFLYAASPVVL